MSGCLGKQIKFDHVFENPFFQRDIKSPKK